MCWSNGTWSDQSVQLSASYPSNSVKTLMFRRKEKEQSNGWRTRKTRREKMRHKDEEMDKGAGYAVYELIVLAKPNTVDEFMYPAGSWGLVPLDPLLAGTRILHRLRPSDFVMVDWRGFCFIKSKLQNISRFQKWWITKLFRDWFCRTNIQ